MEKKCAHFLVLFLLSFEVLAVFSEKHFACLEGSPASAYIHFLFSCDCFLWWGVCSFNELLLKRGSLVKNFFQFDKKDSISNSCRYFWSLISPPHCGASCYPSILPVVHTKYFSVIAGDAQHFFISFCQFIISPFSPSQKKLQAVIRKSMMQKHICRPLYRSCLLFDACQSLLHNSAPPRAYVS